MALAGDDTGVCEIEEFKDLRQGIAEGWNINAAAWRVICVAEIGGGAGLEGGTAGGEVEASADRENRIAQRFGVEAAAVGAGVEVIFRIGGEIGMTAGKLVGAGEYDFADELFGGPTVGDETVGEEIEELGMSGCFAGGAEIVGRTDEASAEEPEPDAIDVNAGGERILRVGDPCGEFESAALVGADGWRGWHVGRGDGEKTARNFIAEFVDAAAEVDVSVVDGRFLLHRHDHGAFVPGIGELLEVAAEFFEVLVEFGELSGIGGGGGGGGIGFGGLRGDELDGVRDDMAVGAGGGNDDVALVAAFEVELTERNEVARDGRGLPFVDVNGGFPGGMKDGDGNFGGAVIAWSVGEANFVFAGGFQIRMESDGLGAFGFVAVVDIGGAEEWFVEGGMLPFADELGLGIINHDPGKRIEGDFFGGGRFGDQFGLFTDGAVQFSNFALVLLELIFLAGRKREGKIEPGGDVGVFGGFNVTKNSGHGVVIASGDGIELMIVTAGATERLAKQTFADGVELFIDNVHAELVFILFFVIEIAEHEVSGGGECTVFLLDIGNGKKVAGDLFGNEAIEREIAIVRIDDIITVAPGVIKDETAEGDGFREAGNVEPMASPAFAEVWRSEELVDEILVGLGRCVLKEGVDLRGRGGETDDVEVKAPEEGGFVGVWRGGEILGGELCGNELVDVGTLPGRGGERRRCGTDGLIGPVIGFVKRVIGEEGRGNQK